MKSAFIFKIFSVVIFTLLLHPARAAALPAAPAGIRQLLTAARYDALFPMRDRFYTYAALVRAADQLSAIKITIEMRGPFMYRISRTDRSSGTTSIIREDQGWNEAWALAKPYKRTEIDYSKFCAAGSRQQRYLELAAFFAQSAHETRNGTDGTFRDGLMLKQEIAPGSDYVTANSVYPPVSGQRYYGRGPLQLSFNGNYGMASACITGDAGVLLSQPDLLNSDPVMAFKTAIYFWMTPQGVKPSAHEVISGSWQPALAEKEKGWSAGFGMVTNIINGALECNRGENSPEMNNRAGYYRFFLRAFGVKDDRNCSCGSMQPFP